MLDLKEEMMSLWDSVRGVYAGGNDSFEMCPVREYPTDREELLYTSDELMLPLKTTTNRESFDFQAGHQRMVQEFDKGRDAYYQFADSGVSTEKDIINNLDETLERINTYEEDS